MFRGQQAWLRVSPFIEHEMSGKAWRGTAEAAVIPGVSKPALLHRIEWHTDGPPPVPVSAEVLTLVTNPPASRERFLRTAPDLPAAWFSDLRASLAALRAYPTDRQFPVHDAEEYGYLLSATYRRQVPAVADQVYEALADMLNTPSGRYAQLVAAALILRNLTRLPDPGRLAARLHAYTDTLFA
jgi:hypothetical protein